MKKSLFVLFFFSFMPSPLPSEQVAERRGLSGFTVGKEVDVTSSLFSLSEESFLSVHQYLNYILNYEKALPNSQEGSPSSAEGTKRNRC